MAQFFIGRPVFAWVLSILIVIFGALALPKLPISQYPNIAPPQVTITATYPGASPENLYSQVAQPIEEELNGIPGLLYFDSNSDSTGMVTVNVTFQSGTEIAQAIVDTQNRVARVESSLPQQVMQQGVRVEEASTSFLMMVALLADEPSRLDGIGLGDYASRNILNEVRRVPGVGRAQLFSSERAMRIWMDADRMIGLKVTADDIRNAITAQNAQVAAGSIGAMPNPSTQQTTATILVTGQLQSPEEFEQIVLRAQEDGSLVTVGDVAEVTIDAESFAFSSSLNGRPSAAIGVQLSPTGNALQVATGVKETMERLAPLMPEGVSYQIPYDTTPFVKASIKKVVMTLVEAVVLVFVVMFLFLQNFRYTVIPTIVVPIALAGTLAVMLAAGFSINVLTMFAMVLAIGILVDDAIVVVENVERIMANEGLPPKEATRKAMGQISGAIIGITLALVAVFVPLAFFPGSVGIIYRQFSLTMVVSILFSAFLALSLTPALCATFLKPIKGHHEKKGFFGWFNRKFDATTNRYTKVVSGMVGRAGRMMVVYVALLVGLGWIYVQIPSSFVPQEDQGYLLADFQGPPGSTENRLGVTTSAASDFAMQQPGVESILMLNGYSFSGSGPNSAMGFITLKDWSERDAEQSAEALSGTLTGFLYAMRDATAYALSPPPIEGLGTSSGFAFRLQDRGNLGQEQLAAARDQLLAAAAESPMLAGVYVEGLPEGPQVQLEIDRAKANAFGVTFADINSTVSAMFGSSYVNDFPNQGKMQQVIIQGSAENRMEVPDLLNVSVRSVNGGMVPISEFATARWSMGPSQFIGYNGYPTVRISGEAAPGYSSGDAIAEMERLAGELPQGFSFEWTGQSLQEIQSGSQAPFLIVLAIVFVFLCLAALYESWAIPFSVMLVVPLGIIGSVLAVLLRGMSNDVYFVVGIITIVGLSAKNAILIVEVAKEQMEEGKSRIDAVVEAARLRFRPILMTSLAFTMGVLPMAIATGASSASQNAIGTNVIGGMISATVLAVLFVPVFFVFVLNLFRRKKDDETQQA